MSESEPQRPLHSRCSLRQVFPTWNHITLDHFQFHLWKHFLLQQPHQTAAGRSPELSPGRDLLLCCHFLTTLVLFTVSCGESSQESPCRGSPAVFSHQLLQTFCGISSRGLARETPGKIPRLSLGPLCSHVQPLRRLSWDCSFFLYLTWFMKLSRWSCRVLYCGIVSNSIHAIPFWSIVGISQGTRFWVNVLLKMLTWQMVNVEKCIIY